MRINYLRVTASQFDPPAATEQEVEKKVEILSTRLRINQYIEEAAGIFILDLLRPPACEKIVAPACAYEPVSVGTYSERGGNILL